MGPRLDTVMGWDRTGPNLSPGRYGARVIMNDGATRAWIGIVEVLDVVFVNAPDV